MAKKTKSDNKAIWVNLPDDVYDSWSQWCETRSFVQKNLIAQVLKWFMRMPTQFRWDMLAHLNEGDDATIRRKLIDALQNQDSDPKKRYRDRAKKPPADSDHEQTA